MAESMFWLDVLRPVLLPMTLMCIASVIFIYVYRFLKGVSRG